MVASLLGAHLAGDGETIVLAVLVVALDIKVGEVDGDPESDKIIILKKPSCPQEEEMNLML